MFSKITTIGILMCHEVRSERPDFFITYGPCGSGKGTVLKQALARKGFVEAIVDNDVEGNTNYHERVGKIYEDPTVTDHLDLIKRLNPKDEVDMKNKLQAFIESRMHPRNREDLWKRFGGPIEQWTMHEMLQYITYALRPLQKKFNDAYFNTRKGVVGGLPVIRDLNISTDGKIYEAVANQQSVLVETTTTYSGWLWKPKEGKPFIKDNVYNVSVVYPIVPDQELPVRALQRLQEKLVNEDPNVRLTPLAHNIIVYDNSSRQQRYTVFNLRNDACNAAEMQEKLGEGFQSPQTFVNELPESLKNHRSWLDAALKVHDAVALKERRRRLMKRFVHSELACTTQ